MYVYVFKCFVFEAGSYYVVQASFELVIFLPLLPSAEIKKAFAT